MKNENLTADSNTYGGLGTLTGKRRNGNSSRQIDHAIQLLFSGKTVAVIDHSGHNIANIDLFKRIIRRLEIEHHQPKIIVDRKKLIIKLERSEPWM